MNHGKSAKLVLAVQPTSHGFGWVLFERPMSLVNWGIASTHNDYATWCMARFEKLVDLYRPQVLVLETRPADKGFSKGRARLLSKAMQGFCANRDIEVHRYAYAEVTEALVAKPVEKRRAIVEAVAGIFPILRDRQPRPRRPWESEDGRRCLFDAAALGVAHFRMTNPKS